VAINEQSARLQDKYFAMADEAIIRERKKIKKLTIQQCRLDHQK